MFQLERKLKTIDMYRRSHLLTISEGEIDIDFEF